MTVYYSLLYIIIDCYSTLRRTKYSVAFKLKIDLIPSDRLFGVVKLHSYTSALK